MMLVHHQREVIVQGRLEVICGCMFSGKTAMLIDRILRARQDGLRVAVLKHVSDDRYAKKELVTHDRQRLPAECVTASADVLARADEADVIAVDEAQFFDNEMPVVCRRLVQLGKQVVLAGLDLDSWGQPFGAMPELAAMADEVVHMHAQCAVCHGVASFTQRTTPVEGSMVGGQRDYEPRCGQCFQSPPAELRR